MKSTERSIKNTCGGATNNLRGTTKENLSSWTFLNDFPVWNGRSFQPI